MTTLVVLAGGEQHQPASDPTVGLGLEGLGQQQRRSGVDGEAQIEFLGRRPVVLNKGLGTAWVGPPELLGVMGRPSVDQHGGAIGSQPAGYGRPDGDAAAGPRHQRHTTGERFPVGHGPCLPGRPVP